MSAELTNMSLENLALYMGGGQPGSMHDQAGKAEFLRRQTLAIQETATATKRHSFYMLLSVVLLVLTAIVGAVFNYLNYIKN